MSGPKCSSYVIFGEDILNRLSDEQNRRLEEERRIRREAAERAREFSDSYNEAEKSEFEFLALKRDFDLCLADYLAACEVSGDEPEEISFNPDTAADDIKRLRELTRAQEKAAGENAKNRYIAESIDKCLREVGFDRIYEAGGKSKMTVYDFGDNTGISVVSTGNRAAFEVAGISSAADKQAITAKMDSFCKAFDDLETKLREKGIETNNVYRMPTDERYARIIDIPRKNTRIRTDEEGTGAISAERKRSDGK